MNMTCHSLNSNIVFTDAFAKHIFQKLIIMDYFEELQCFFCTQNGEQSELIEMSSNAIQIGDDVIDFGVLIRETFEFSLVSLLEALSKYSF